MFLGMNLYMHMEITKEKKTTGIILIKTSVINFLYENKINPCKSLNRTIIPRIEIVIATNNTMYGLASNLNRSHDIGKLRSIIIEIII